MELKSEAWAFCVLQVLVVTSAVLACLHYTRDEYQAASHIVLMASGCFFGYIYNKLIVRARLAERNRERWAPIDPMDEIWPHAVRAASLSETHDWMKEGF